jgi:hypothetical protein
MRIRPKQLTIVVSLVSSSVLIAAVGLPIGVPGAAALDSAHQHTVCGLGVVSYGGQLPDRGKEQ